ncbi:MAG: Fe-S cluster domain-containing protein [Mailhella sp.]|nr:Fe-S cluster domain-containing protein [Mailhella sp.]
MVLSSILMLTMLGFVAAALLAVASRVFAVDEDPRVEAVTGTLPGANCGGCGYAGCEGYAVAVIKDPAIAPNLCVVGGPAVAAAIGELTGQLSTEREPLITHRRCDKNAGDVKPKYDYQGIPTCAAAASLHFGSDTCDFSCLGFGDCVKACTFDALHVENYIVHVNESVCGGCGACTKVCPRSVLQLIPRRSKVAMSCSTKDRLKAVMDVCAVGCIHCGKCVKVCPAKAIAIEDDRVQIDYEKCLACTDCGEACALACPRKILRLRGGAVLAHYDESRAISPALAKKIAEKSA